MTKENPLTSYFSTQPLLSQMMPQSDLVSKDGVGCEN